MKLQLVPLAQTVNPETVFVRNCPVEFYGWEVFVYGHALYCSEGGFYYHANVPVRGYWWAMPDPDFPELLTTINYSDPPEQPSIDLGTTNEDTYSYSVVVIPNGRWGSHKIRIFWSQEPFDGEIVYIKGFPVWEGETSPNEVENSESLSSHIAMHFKSWNALGGEDITTTVQLQINYEDDYLDGAGGTWTNLGMSLELVNFPRTNVGEFCGVG